MHGLWSAHYARRGVGSRNDNATITLWLRPYVYHTETKVRVVIGEYVPVRLQTRTRALARSHQAGVIIVGQRRKS